MYKMRCIIVIAAILLPILSFAQLRQELFLNQRDIPVPASPKFQTKLTFKLPSEVKEQKALAYARYIGMAGGGFMGCMQLYWSATGMSGVHGTFFENVVTATPSIMLGGYVGSKMTVWMTQKLIDGKTTPLNGIWKGAMYGAIDGAVTFTSAIMPLLVIGNYIGTIKFNERNADLILLQLIGASIGGGIGYGGTFGLMFGTVYGPGVSIYMGF